jgi:hypothetical protein
MIPEIQPAVSDDKALLKTMVFCGQKEPAVTDNFPLRLKLSAKAGGTTNMPPSSCNDGRYFLNRGEKCWIST